MNKENVLLPISIIFAGVLIAGAVIYTSSGRMANLNTNLGQNVNDNTGGNNGPDNGALNPVTDADHIIGDINAPVKLIEFSDMQCPYCANFHPTAKRITEEYKGKVAWVYRHFPLESIHPFARDAAIGSECAAELGGNDAFWKFIDKVFSDQQNTVSDLPKVASDIGLNKDSFSTCLKSGKYDSVVDANIDDAVKSGGQGTPWTIVINEKGEKFPINGAQPYEQVKAIIEKALQ